VFQHKTSSFNTRHLICGSLKVKIVKVDSSTFLWVQLENSREDFEELLEDLTRRMTRWARLLRHRSDHIFPAGRGPRRKGMTERDRDPAGKGRSSYRRPARLRPCHPVYDIYILEDRFRELEWQAILCGLAHIQPIGARSR